MGVCGSRTDRIGHSMNLFTVYCVLCTAAGRTSESEAQLWPLMRATATIETAGLTLRMSLSHAVKFFSWNLVV